MDGDDLTDMRATDDGGWILNERSTFPLTIYGMGEATVRELRRVLDDSANLGAKQAARRIHALVAAKGVRCREVEEYVERFKSAYLSDETMTVIPCCNLDALFSDDEAWRAGEVALLIAHTYRSGVTYHREIEDGKVSGVIGGWKILASDDACECCQHAASMKYTLDKPPQVPVHIGCCCCITSELKSTAR